MKDFAIALIIVAVLLFEAWTWLMEPVYVQKLSIKTDVCSIVKVAMKYHGVWHAWCENGVYWFDRDGKRHRLLNLKFIKTLKWM